MTLALESMVAVYVNEPFGKEKARDYREEVDQLALCIQTSRACVCICTVCLCICLCRRFLGSRQTRREEQHEISGERNRVCL